MKQIWVLLLVGTGALVGCSSGEDGTTPDVFKSADIAQSGCESHSQCESSNVCLAGRCDDGECTLVSVEGQCDDGDPCTIDDGCADGLCAGTLMECADEFYCNGREFCDPATGECLDGPPPLVDDGIACTEDWCDEGVQGVVHSPDHDSCSDGNPCTLNLCSLQEDCTTEEQNNGCDDDDPCTADDFCEAGQCNPGEWTCLEVCDNELDDDFDDAIDCQDDDCEGDVSCLPPEEICDDDMDNNGDDLVDCDDPQCEGLPVCEPGLEDCFDGVDNNGDGDSDCEDVQCTEVVQCQPVDNDSCAASSDLNDGQPVGTNDVPLMLEIESATWTATDEASPPCSADSSGAADIFYTVTLSDTLVLDAKVSMSNNAWPAIYVLDESCTETEQSHCAIGAGGTADLTTVLAPGTWFVVVDGAYPPDKGDVELTLQFTAPLTTEDNCNNGLDDDEDGALDCEDDDCAQFPGCADPYEPNDLADSAANLGILQPGQEKKLLPLAYVAGSNDQDWFRFKTPVAGWLSIEVLPEANLDIRLALFEESGAPIAVQDSSGKGQLETILLTTPPSGSYLLLVDGAAGTSGQFSATLLLAPAADSELDCFDGEDNDLDSFLDCDDSDCFSLAQCGGGDDCLAALVVNDGVPVSTPPGVTLEYEGTTAGHANGFAGSCSPKSGHAPDAVWKAWLTDETMVTATVNFLGPAWPSVYLREANCSAPDVACGNSNASSTATAMGTVGPGEVFIIVDGDWDESESDYVLTLHFETAVPETLCGDGTDNDLDGETDCCDSDCEEEPACLQEGDCTDGLDHDCDGLLDCSDDDCTQQSACLGFVCLAPHLITDQGPLTAADSGWSTQLQGHTEGKGADYEGSCSAASGNAEDEVWSFELAQPMFATFTVQPTGFNFPVLTIYEGSCDLQSQVVCEKTMSGTLNVQSLPLTAGQYFVVIDANVGTATFPYDLDLSFVAVSDNETDCYDGLDNDLDGLPDCLDPDCGDSQICLGESCASPYDLNDGIPIAEGDDGLELVLAGDTSTMAPDHEGSCSVDSLDCADAAYRFTLDTRMRVTAFHEFEGLQWPALYVLEGCQDPVEIGCDFAAQGAAAWTGILDPGSYTFIVDAAFVGDAGAYQLDVLFEIPKETDCGDGTDNDDDGLVDCFDPDCGEDADCEGETCATAQWLNEGQPIGQLFDGDQLLVAGNTDGMSPDLGGSCSVSSYDAPDAVWAFKLADPMEVTVVYDFDQAVLFPAVYLFSNECTAEELQECAYAEKDPASFTVQLPAGTHYIVADADFGGDAGAYTLLVSFSIF